MPKDSQHFLQQSEQQHQSDTESILSSQFDELNYARIYDSCEKQGFLTPSKKKSTLKRKKQQDETDSDDQNQQQYNWRTQFTKTIYQSESSYKQKSNHTQRTLSPVKKWSNSNINNKQNQQQQQYLQQTPLNKNKRQQKTAKNNLPVQSQFLTSKQMRTITVRLKNTTQVKYENLCSICLDIHNDIQGQLKCGHKFCFQCIQEWTKSSTNCPCCRYKFNQIVKKNNKINDNNHQNNNNHNNNKNNNHKNHNNADNKHSKTTSPNPLCQQIQIIKVQQKQMTYNQLDYFICTQCNRGDDEDVLLICDSCDFYCCHVYCDRQLNNTFPTDDWYCKNCKDVIRQSKSNIQRSQREEDGLELPIENRNIQNNHNQVRRTQTIRVGSQRTNTVNNQLNQQQRQLYDPLNIQVSQQNINYLRLTQNNNNARSGSKARQIFSEYKPKVNIRLQRILNQITNHTSRNLRNLRRRRHY